MVTARVMNQPYSPINSRASAAYPCPEAISHPCCGPVPRCGAPWQPALRSPLAAAASVQLRRRRLRSGRWHAPSRAGCQRTLACRVLAAATQHMPSAAAPTTRVTLPLKHRSACCAQGAPRPSEPVSGRSPLTRDGSGLHAVHCVSTVHGTSRMHCACSCSLAAAPPLAQILGLRLPADPIHHRDDRQEQRRLHARQGPLNGMARCPGAPCKCCRY